MDKELEFVCEKCVHYEVCDRSSRMIWARLSKEKVCTDFMEVVRCKDCKYYEHPEYYGGGTKDVCRTFKRQTKGDDFCSYGERKDK